MFQYDSKCSFTITCSPGQLTCKFLNPSRNMTKYCKGNRMEGMPMYNYSDPSEAHSE